MVQRELREGSRRPFNHWLRVGSALAGMTLFYFNLAIFGRNAPEAMVGAQLFSSLHILLLTLICCIVPTMTADCISREKREGTLGLLFLTGLTPAGIVLGKSLVQALRAFTLWVAVLPVLTIPFLTGGVSWTNAISAVTMEFCVAVLCLAGGLLASTLAKARAIAFALALTFAFGFVVLFGQISPFHPFAGSFLAPLLAPRIGLFAGYGGPGMAWQTVSYGGQSIISRRSNAISFRPMLLSKGVYVARAAAATSSMTGMLILAGSVAASLLIFLLVIRIAARRIDHSWRDKIPSAKRASLLKRYCTPLFKSWFSRRLGHALDHNPIAWLQQYSWKARTSKWGLCLAFVILECNMMGGGLDGIERLQIVLVGVLAVVFTFVGVNSFLEEKKTGALELILITPLSVNQIIRGRVWGLWKQFFPALLILGGFYAAAATSPSHFNYYYEPRDTLMPMMLVLTGFLTLPIFATYFALRVKNLIVAGALTWVAIILAPLMGYGAIDQLFWRLDLNMSNGSIFGAVILGDIGFALLTAFLLRHSLSRRIYSF